MTEVTIAATPPKKRRRRRRDPGSRAALSMRLSRARKARGLLCIQIELRQGEVEGLLRRGLLAPERVRDRLAIRRAVHELFDLVQPFTRTANGRPWR